MPTKLTNTNIVFNNSSSQSSAWLGRRGNVFLYTGSTQTFTIPDGITSLKVVVVGGGGGGGGSGGTSSVSSGTQTITTISATGGSRARHIEDIGVDDWFTPGGGGSGSNGDINLAGQRGEFAINAEANVYNNSYKHWISGIGGSSTMGSGGRGPGYVITPTGSESSTAVEPSLGGGAGGGLSLAGEDSAIDNIAFSGGGAGGTAIKFLTGLTPGLTLNITVGAGGTAKTLTRPLTVGGNGIIMFEY